LKEILIMLLWFELFSVKPSTALESRSRIVASSDDEESEMQEVYNKLRALNTALDLAEQI
jgi:anthranilate/para-aminobenzoate synthase component I